MLFGIKTCSGGFEEIGSYGWTSQFALVHKDHEPSPPSIPDSSVGLQRYVHAGFFQNGGAGMLSNVEVQDIWTSPISFAQEFFFSLLEVTIVC